MYRRSYISPASLVKAPRKLMPQCQRRLCHTMASHAPVASNPSVFRNWAVKIKLVEAEPAVAGPVTLRFTDMKTNHPVSLPVITHIHPDCSYNVDLPHAFEPALLTVTVGGNGLVCFDSVTMRTNGSRSCYFPMVSWVAASHGERTFFERSLWQPSEEHIRIEQLKELKHLRGESKGQNPALPRSGTERIYRYDTYCDLGSAGGKSARPTLGGDEFPYPRRLQTNRAKTADGVEPKMLLSSPWLPQDELFSYSRAVSFTGASFQGALPAILEAFEQAFRYRSGFERIPVLGPVLTLLDLLFKKKNLQFEKFSDLSNLFLSPQIELPGDIDDDTAETLARRIGDIIDRVSQLTGGGRDSAQALQLKAVVKAAFGKDIQLLRSHRVPKVLAGRPSAWHQDAEFGRQMLAGMNPCTLQALDAWPKEGWKMSEKDVEGLLGGKSIHERLEQSKKSEDGKPTLFFVDYHEPFASYTDNVNVPGVQGRHLYGGRVLLMLTSDVQDEVARPDFVAMMNKPAELEDPAITKLPKPPKGPWLIPLAIELTDEQGTRVYTAPKPKADTDEQHSGKPAKADKSTPPQVWLLAKMAFLNLDSAVHQLISHWQRTHCAIEPFLIATRRQLSMTHPVHKLMMPHFRYTLRINANARGSLISADGIVERLFTPGAYCMRLASEWYGKNWTFTSQALPEDLKRRGLMERAVVRDGELELLEAGKQLLADYPYAEDGILIWDALRTYFREYLGIYYKTDGAGSADLKVKADLELQMWWREIKVSVNAVDLTQEEGHPDIAAGWPSLNGVDDLLFILTTMAWTASAHHAAVNFGQYDHAGFILNRSSMFKKAIPAPGSKEYNELSMAKGEKLEKLLLEYVMGPAMTAAGLFVLRLLSTHAKDEMYLDDEEQKYFGVLKDAEDTADPEVKAAHGNFLKKMEEVEEEINNRNNDPARTSRRPEAGGMPYTLLLPSSGPGLTMRGVPYSTSI